jgi:hypothetical protein
VANDVQSGVQKNGFLRSNLFIFLLGQAFAFICWLCIFAFGWGKYSERFTTLDTSVGELKAKTARMDEHGSTYLLNIEAQQQKAIGEVVARLERMEKETAHYDVMEYEHRRLTEDVEKLKNGQKK